MAIILYGSMESGIPLLEENRATLARLEELWLGLGALRKVTFHAKFSDDEFAPPSGRPPPEERAARFVVFAQTLGFGGTSYSDEDGNWSTSVSKQLVPTAEVITDFQEQFTSFASSEGGYLSGWAYPQSREVEFWPNERRNANAVRARSDVLFGVAPVLDHADGPGLRHRGPSARAGQFRLVPSEFLRRAQSMPPATPEPTASAFSQWVYSLYADAYGSQEDRDHGKNAEAAIWDARVEERRRTTPSCVDNGFLRDAGSPWRLIHNGLHDLLAGRPKYFELPLLRVQGEALRASPDLLYLNKQDSRAAVVEIKYSHMAIPKNLWPNIWAQLWCYSHIEHLVQVNETTVIGEVWGERWAQSSGSRRRGIVPGERLICLRSSVRRDPRLPQFDRFFRKLFEIYGGH